MYIPVIIWLISAAIAYAIANKRNVRTNLGWNLLITFLGPLATPLIFSPAPAKTDTAE